MGELVDRAAVELAGGHELVTRLHDGMEGEQLGRVARCHRERGRAALERRHLAFERSLGGVHDAGVDVAEGAQRKKVGGVLHVVEDVGRGLIDRRDARARRGVRRLAGMQRQRVETRCSLGHVFVSRFVVGARDYRGNERRTIEGFCGGAGLAESGSHPPCRAPSPILRTGEGSCGGRAPSSVAEQWERVAEGRMRAFYLFHHGSMRPKIPSLSMN